VETRHCSKISRELVQSIVQNTQLDQQPQPGADRNLQITPKVRNHHFNMYALIPPPLIRLHVI
jgi:hypothetical protein